MIISNVPIPNKNDEIISYERFKEMATSDEGLTVEDSLYFNVEELDEDLYELLCEVDDIDIYYFTITGNKPNFIKHEVLNWQITKQNNTDINSNLETNEVQEGESIDDTIVNTINNLIDDSTSTIEENNKKEAKVYVFGSSKGGTGKTFTAIISTYRYAKTHPHQKIALLDFDIIDGQVGISIHKVKPTMRQFFTEYQKGYKDFYTMNHFSVKAKPPFPQNVDFYLAPNSDSIIRDNNFWLCILKNCIENYDVVVIDTGIDYLNLAPISYAYKIADKIILTTTTSIKSVNSVTKQIGKLKGEIENPVFSIEDNIGPHLNIVITQMTAGNEMNKTIYNILNKKCNIIATFGALTDSIAHAEYYGMWDIFDKNHLVNKALDDIMS